VLVVFDALQVTLMENADGTIDASRFPSFAALVGEATWYRNATTAHENTVYSVPAILDGRAPMPGVPPTLAGHPQNLFTLLGDHRMNVSEEATTLCPERLCGRHPSPNIIQRLKHGRVKRFDRVLSRIHAGGPPTLTFVHAFFPHEPRQYLPNGHAYQPGADPEPALDGPPSFTNPWLTQQSLQRTLLQMMFTDRLVGRLVARLRATGQWDKTLLVLTADHGESFQVKRTAAAPFRPGRLHWRRAVTIHNIQEIAPVPLFVKYPGQQHGHVDERFVKTIDVLPTIADVTEHPANWAVAGRSLRDSAYTGHPEVSVGTSDGGEVSMPDGRWLARVKDTYQRALQLFPAGTGLDGLYGIGPHPELHGRLVSELRVLRRGRLRAVLTEPLRLQVIGRLTGGRPAGHRLAIATRGRIAATSWSFPALGAMRLNISSLLPEAALRGSGRASLRVYEIVGSSRLRPLD
jgi:hypothetical protein